MEPRCSFERERAAKDMIYGLSHPIDSQMYQLDITLTAD